MLILLTAPAMLGNQSLAAGVMADVPDDVAQRLIEAGVAQALDQPAPESQQAEPQPRKRAKTQE